MSFRQHLTMATGLFVLTATTGAGVVAQARPVAGGFRSDSLELSHGSERYRLRIFLPPAHDTVSSSLPTVYYLDGWWWGSMFEELVRLAATTSPPRTSPAILVGISTVGDADDWNRARNRDLTPSPYRPIAPGITMRTGNVILDSAGTGGAAEFLAFLEQDVFPAVEKRYRASPVRRGLVGHSYGGLFATWVLANRPNLFESYLIVSPSVYWNDNEVLNTDWSGRDDSWQGEVFLAVGGRELQIMRRSADALAAVVEAMPGAVLERAAYPGADHLTVLPRALLDGFIHLYRQ